MLPKNLVFVRHGYSEANAASHEVGVKLPENFYEIPDWRYRLAPRGRKQAEITSEWLKYNYSKDYFKTALVSTHVRARETAALLRLGLNWKINLNLCERDSGLHNLLEESLKVKDLKLRITDPLFHRMGQGTGQSIADILVSSTFWFFDTLHREHSEQNVIAVCHGERMLAIRYVMERMTPEQFEDRVSSKNSNDKIFNCQIIHYTRVNPEDQNDIRETCEWYRSCCPSYDKGEMPDTGWVKIERRLFSDEDLLQQVERYPHYIN